MRVNPNARRTDPDTSHAGAFDVRARSRAQQEKLILVHLRHPEGLTDYEAAHECGLDEVGISYWKRCSELREQGFLRYNGEKRVSPITGSAQRVSVITPEGRVFAKSLLED